MARHAAAHALEARVLLEGRRRVLVGGRAVTAAPAATAAAAEQPRGERAELIEAHVPPQLAALPQGAVRQPREVVPHDDRHAARLHALGEDVRRAAVPSRGPQVARLQHHLDELAARGALVVHGRQAVAAAVRLRERRERFDEPRAQRVRGRRAAVEAERLLTTVRRARGVRRCELALDERDWHVAHAAAREDEQVWPAVDRPPAWLTGREADAVGILAHRHVEHVRSQQAFECLAQPQRRRVGLAFAGDGEEIHPLDEEWYEVAKRPGTAARIAAKLGNPRILNPRAGPAMDLVRLVVAEWPRAFHHLGIVPFERAAR